MKLTIRNTKVRDDRGQMVSATFLGNGSIADEVDSWLTNNPDAIADAASQDVSDWLEDNITQPTNPVIDTSLSVSGAAADAKKTGDELDELRSVIAHGSGLTDGIKSALMQVSAAVVQLAQKVGYPDDTNGVTYYNALVDANDALYDALYSGAAVARITCVYTQTGTVYDNAPLNSLKNNLTVTAHWDNGTTSVVANTAYTLSGTLTVGVSTITVSYSGKTTSFSVNVTEHTTVGWYYPFNGSLVSQGTKDFGFTGAENYTTGRLGTDQAYWHKVTTEGDSTTDTGAIKAINLTETPDFSGNFTVSFWHKSCTEKKGHPFTMSKFLNTRTSATLFHDSVSDTGKGWEVNGGSRATKKYVGLTWWWYQDQLIIAPFSPGSATADGNSTQFKFTPPSNFSSLDWHHYALTRDGDNYYFFVDGVKQTTFVSSYGIYEADQICIGSLFVQSTEEASNISNMPNGDCVQDLYITETCRWTDDFDPNTIIY